MLAAGGRDVPEDTTHWQCVRVTATLAVRVHGSGSVRLVADTGCESAELRVDLDRAQLGMIRLFQRWLAEGWAQPAQRKLTRRDELEVLGMLLFARLFPGELQTRLDEAVASASSATPLRLDLVFEDGAEQLSQLPWEYLYRDGAVGSGYFLAVQPRISLSRSTPLASPVRPPPQPPVSILAAAAKPSDEGTVRESPTITALHDLAGDGSVQVDLLDHPTLDRLSEAIGRLAPDVLHLLGHGEFDRVAAEGRFALEDEAGRAHWVPDHLLADAILGAGSAPHVVVLHACDGAGAAPDAPFAGLARRLVRVGVEAVIAMQYPITNAAANAFSTELYAALADGRPLDIAVQSARMHMTLRRPSTYDSGEFGIPVLYLRRRPGSLPLVAA